jgi:hypothetical protein
MLVPPGMGGSGQQDGGVLNHVVTILWARYVSQCVQQLWTACLLSHSVVYALIVLFCNVCRSSTWIGDLQGLGCPKNLKIFAQKLTFWL